MIILGVDPGYGTIGYGVIEKNGSKIVPIDYGVIQTPKDEGIAARLAMIYDSLNVLIKKFRPDEIAVEELFFNTNITTGIKVAQARGVILLCAVHECGRLYEYTPLMVKQSLTGNGRADKKQIQYMVKMMLGLKTEPKPDDAVTGIISGIVASGALQPGASASQFADLTSGSWYYDGVRCALENGLMTGTSARTFAPDRPVTRAMLVTILWRLAGEPYGRVSPFEDVLPGSWYAQAVSWAYDKGIVTGVTATSFQPSAPVTREQLCAILCRYAALTGKNTAASASLDAFTDRAQVSAYAEASVRWALQAGLLTGVGDGRLAPRSGATRAQLAVLLQRFAGLK